MLVVCDAFSYEDYPVSVLPGQDVRKVFDEYNAKSMQRVMEVYALHLDWKVQMNELRSFHFEKPSVVTKIVPKAKKAAKKAAKPRAKKSRAAPSVR